MPFSMTELSIIISLPQIVTLQVRIPNRNAAVVCRGCHGRKAFLSISASMTLEAAMVLTLLIFASVSLILPMKILNTERKVQAALEAVGEDFSRYAYLKDVIAGGKESAAAGADEFAKAFCRQLGAGVAEGYAQARVMEYVDTEAVEGMTMERSEILRDGEHFDLILDYQIRMPFPVLGMPAIRRTARCRRRAWIGKVGKDADGDGSSIAKDEYVYVGKGSTRYHRSRSCHYLSNQLTAVSADAIDEARNQSGGRYHACSVCVTEGAAGGTVYVMPQGSSYHSSKVCTAIVAYVRMVKLSEVEHLGACSYCGR